VGSERISLSMIDFKTITFFQKHKRKTGSLLPIL